MIRGYPREASVWPGGRLTLHVSASAPRFRVSFFRIGATAERLGGIADDEFPAVEVQEGPPDQDWRWPAYEFEVPHSWPSGAYIAQLSEVDERAVSTAPDSELVGGDSGKVLFVVRNPEPGSGPAALYKISLATFHAYNVAGHGSLYTQAVWARDVRSPGYKVSLRRPGGGVGGPVMPGDAPDAYDPSSRRQTFDHWDSPFIAHLEAAGYRFDYCTDVDLHREARLLASYRLLLSVGHDEYWSEDMRRRVEEFIEAGGNVAFFSANTCWWRIHFTDGDTAFTCDKASRPPGTRSVRTDMWFASRPENSLTGVSYRNGGGWWNGLREALGYTVQNTGHWVFEGTGLRDGDMFGDSEEFPLIGYEVDGAEFELVNGRAMATGEGGTPPNFLILGTAELGPGWSCLPNRSGRHAATMGTYTSAGGGIVFTAATTDWPKLLARYPAVDRITRIVIDRLSCHSIAIAGPLPAEHGYPVVVEGGYAEFHVEAEMLGGGKPASYRWKAVGADPAEGEGTVFRVRMPAARVPVTIAVEKVRDGVVVGFGSVSVSAISDRELAVLGFLTTMREMVLPGEPSNPFVDGAGSPIEKLDLVTLPRIRWILERGEEMRRIGERLLGERTD